MTSILETAKQVVGDPGEIAATKDQLIAAIQAGANQADIRNFERAIWQLFDRAHATKVLLEANNSLRTTLSRQAELLGRAAKALEPMHRAHEAIAQHDPTFPEDGAALRASFDWFVMCDADPHTVDAALKRRACTRAHLRTASSTLNAIRDELKEPNDVRT